MSRIRCKKSHDELGVHIAIIGPYPGDQLIDIRRYLSSCLAGDPIGDVQDDPTMSG